MFFLNLGGIADVSKVIDVNGYIPNVMRKRYNITTSTKLEFIPRMEGIMVRSVREEGSFGELAGSASKHWTLDEMLKRLEELRKEHV